MGGLPWQHTQLIEPAQKLNAPVLRMRDEQDGEELLSLDFSYNIDFFFSFF